MQLVVANFEKVYKYATLKSVFHHLHIVQSSSTMGKAILCFSIIWMCVVHTNAMAQYREGMERNMVNTSSVTVPRPGMDGVHGHLDVIMDVLKSMAKESNKTNNQLKFMINKVLLKEPVENTFIHRYVPPATAWENFTGKLMYRQVYMLLYMQSCEREISFNLPFLFLTIKRIKWQ